MRVSKTALSVLVLMLLLSIFLANVANILSTEITYDSSENVDVRGLKMTDKLEHLIWFIQITDLHISIFRDPSRITEFREFCDYTLNIIKPIVVLASGDLTDAKTFDNIGSQQFEGEWKNYRNILDELHVLNKTTWLDIRGNHDNFNVAGHNSTQNFFTNYSVQGKRHPRSYMHQVRVGSDLYSFIGVDACLEPGPRRPFNFIGMLDDEEVDEIERLIGESERTGSNYSIWFGHFPTSCIISPGHIGVRTLIKKDKKSLIYVCGHLHTLGGLVPKMYTLQKEGFLELELGDWKDNRVFRVLALDHGILSFADVPHRSWPVVVVTNPKDSLFLIPNKEKVSTIKESTHIRLLAFSLAKIDSVKVKINNEDWLECTNTEGPLYVHPWNPQKYKRGLQRLEVYVTDVEGRKKRIIQHFSLDHSRLAFEILPRIALMSDASTIFKAMFGTMIILTTLPLCVFRYLHKLTKEKKMERPIARGNCIKHWLRKFWILATVDRLFWPIILYPVYLTFGPWSIGYLVEDHIGIIFAWGIFVNGTFLPGSFTYAYGFAQLLTFHLPLTLILAHGIDVIFRYRIMQSAKPRSLLTNIGLHLPFSVIIVIQILMAYFFWLAYGMLAFFLGFLRTWSIVLAVVLWHYTLHLPEKCIREAAVVWAVKPNSARSD